MLRVLVLKKRTLYIALAILIIVVLGILLLTVVGSDETFSQTMKYAYKKISPEQAKVLLEKNSDVTILDVREEEEYLQGHLPSATQLTYKELKNNLDVYHKDHVYILYSKTDDSCTKVADLMASNGFSKIYMLNGGLSNWPYEIE